MQQYKPWTLLSTGSQESFLHRFLPLVSFAKCVNGPYAFFEMRAKEAMEGLLDLIIFKSSKDDLVWMRMWPRRADIGHYWDLAGFYA